MSKTRIDPDLYERFYAQADRVRAREDEKSRDSQIKRETVYTPFECVDFINQSVADILMREFCVSMNDPGYSSPEPRRPGSSIPRGSPSTRSNLSKTPPKSPRETCPA